jgi:hypothetical protein
MNGRFVHHAVLQPRRFQRLQRVGDLLQFAGAADDVQTQ